MLKAFVFPIWLILHPVHVTMTSIDLVPATDSMKVFFRMYYDDFLCDYKLYDTISDMSLYPGDKPIPAEMVNKYFNNKVCIFINNKHLEGKLLSMNLINNEISLNLLYRSVKKPKKITVRNMILTGLYSDQANMTIIRINDFEEGVKLTPEHNEESLSLK